MASANWDSRRRDERRSTRDLKIVHVVSGLEIADGGPSYSVPSLKDALRRAGVDAAVFADLTPGDSANDASDRVYSFERKFGRVPLLRKFHFSGDLARRMYDHSERMDLVHSHGLWRMPNIYAAAAARQRGVPHVVSPRGMLSEAALKVSRLGKKLFWVIGQKSALEPAACFHATSAGEYEDIRKFGVKAPVAIVPNGVDLPDTELLTKVVAPRHAERQRTLLYLGRIHPIKGLDGLVIAWSKIETDFSDWRLTIVGPGEPEHIQSLRNLIQRLGVRHVSIEGPVFGTDKWRLISNVDVTILPSYSENFGMAVAESLACGRPVIATRGSPWKDVEMRKLGWWIDIGPGSIEANLRIALATPVETLDEMGARGAAWVKDAFSWGRIGEKMAEVYRWLCHGEARPGHVVHD